MLRKLFGETRSYPVLASRTPARWFKGNPVYDVDGLEVTVWNFDHAQCRRVNLFPDGTLGTSYLLADARPPRVAAESSSCGQTHTLPR